MLSSYSPASPAASLRAKSSTDDSRSGGSKSGSVAEGRYKRAANGVKERNDDLVTYLAWSRWLNSPDAKSSLAIEISNCNGFITTGDRNATSLPNSADDPPDSSLFRRTGSGAAGGEQPAQGLARMTLPQMLDSLPGVWFQIAIEGFDEQKAQHTVRLKPPRKWKSSGRKNSNGSDRSSKRNVFDDNDGRLDAMKMDALLRSNNVRNMSRAATKGVTMKLHLAHYTVRIRKRRKSTSKHLQKPQIGIDRDERALGLNVRISESAASSEHVFAGFHGHSSTQEDEGRKNGFCDDQDNDDAAFVEVIQK